MSAVSIWRIPQPCSKEERRLTENRKNLHLTFLSGLSMDSKKMQRDIYSQLGTNMLINSKFIRKLELKFWITPGKGIIAVSSPTDRPDQGNLTA